MIDAELYARIRRLFFAEHWKVGTIAAELGLHHDTVRHAIESDRFARSQRQLRASMLDPYKPFIGEVLDKHPKLRATRILEMLRPRGYPGGYLPVMRYVRSVRPAAKAEAFLKLQTLPGEQAQVDWGHFGKIQVGAATRSLSCFVLVLSWSRAMFARFTLDQTLETFLFGHALAGNLHFCFAQDFGEPREVARYAAFMDELVHGKVPYGCVRPEEALDSHRLFTAALESQRTRQAVELQ